MRRGTNVNPFRPTTALATQGIFEWTRNPLYVGILPVMCGVALIFALDWLLLLAIPSYFVLHFCVIKREEQYLERKFGDEYRRYKSLVPRYVRPSLNDLRRAKFRQPSRNLRLDESPPHIRFDRRDGRHVFPVGHFRHGGRIDPYRHSARAPAGARSDAAARRDADGVERLARIALAQIRPLSHRLRLCVWARNRAAGMVFRAIRAEQARCAAVARTDALHGQTHTGEICGRMPKACRRARSTASSA